MALYRLLSSYCVRCVVLGRVSDRVGCDVWDEVVGRV